MQPDQSVAEELVVHVEAAALVALEHLIALLLKQLNSLLRKITIMPQILDALLIIVFGSMLLVKNVIC